MISKNLSVSDIKWQRCAATDLTTKVRPSRYSGLVHLPRSPPLLTRSVHPLLPPLLRLPAFVPFASLTLFIYYIPCYFLRSRLSTIIHVRYCQLPS